MHLLLCIANRLDLERKSDEDASYNDLKISTYDDIILIDWIERELKAGKKTLSESKINKIEKIMQTNNASSNQQLIYCNR